MIKFLRSMSDVHLEFGTFEIQKLDTDKETILLLNGDIHVKDGILKNDWLKSVSDQFAHVVYILGNHEHYNSSLDRTSQKIKIGINNHQLPNVTLLENEAFIIPGSNIKIIGGTMWTDFNKGNPVTQYVAEGQMNDYWKIRCHDYGRRLKARYLIVEHLKFKTFLEEELKKDFDGTVIVMTHHAPHQMSLNPMYANDYHGNGCYASDLSEVMLDNPKIKYWFHGHVHHNSDYNIGECRIICNPRGYYPTELNTGFDPVFMIEL